MVAVARRASVAILAAVLAACGTTPAPPPSAEPNAQAAAPSTGWSGSPAAPSIPAFDLPFAAGSLVSLGDFGLHDSNFRSVPGGYTLAGAGSVTDASLDILAPAGTPVHPLAKGTVLSAWPDCNVVLVDHGGGTWVAYLHIRVEVTDGAQATSATVLGYLLPAPASGASPDPRCGNLESNAPHVHFAFLTGTGTQGQYLSMSGRLLCGHAVDGAGAMVGLGQAGGQAFVVPDCGSGSASASSPAPATSASPGSSPTPNPTPTPTPTFQVPGIAEVLVDSLRVRTRPEISDNSIRLVPLLSKPRRIALLEGPVMASGYNWFFVAPLDLGTTFAPIGSLGGWVGSASRDGEPWIRALVPRCPRPPTSLKELAALDRLA